MGRVVDGSGAPIPQAHVVLVAATEQATCRTDKRGRYELDIHWKQAGRIPCLTVTRRGFAPGRAQLDYDRLMRDPTKFPMEDIVLHRGKALIGRVMSSDVGAVAAVVRVIPERGDVPPPTWTDASGRFCLPVAPGDVLELRVNHPKWGFCHTFVRCGAGLEVEDVGDLHLQPVSSLSGNLFLPYGCPAEGIKFTLRHMTVSFGSTRDVHGNGAVLAGGRTSRGGFFEFHGLEPGTFRLQCENVIGALSQAIPVETQKSAQRLVLPYVVVSLQLRALEGRDMVFSRLQLEVTRVWPPQSSGAHRAGPRRLVGVTRFLLPTETAQWRVRATVDDLAGGTLVMVSPGVDIINVHMTMNVRQGR